MPVTLVDRVPLPNLKVYTAGSVVLLSLAIYHAINVTSNPNWRLNSTLQRQEAVDADAIEGESVKMVQALITTQLDIASNGTRNLTEQFVEVMSYMMQEPLCMWTLINIAYCSLAVFGFFVQRLVFGKLRVSEAQRVKDKFWNYVFYKFIFVFGVINVQYMDEVLLWCSWFTLVGFLHLLGQLCKDRFEYLSSSPNTPRWSHIRLLCLLGGIIASAVALLAVATAWGLPAGRDTFAFMAAECILVLVSVSHVVARYVLQAYDADVAGPVAYYTHLIFDSCSLVVELVHVVHMVVWSNMLVSMASLVLLMQLRHLLHELQARVRRHRLYTQLAVHMSQNYPMASKEEVEKNQDNCAICWEPMKEARKLPCSHLFHNSCLCQWMQQDASCPTCRRALAARSQQAAAHTARAPGDAPPPPPPRPNHLFHFDGSRYVSWLPSFSVEVTRVPMDPPLASHIEAMARQVQTMFPQYPLGALVADLAATRSADLTVENILEGRLAPPPPPPEPPVTTRMESPTVARPVAADVTEIGATDAVTHTTASADTNTGTEVTTTRFSKSPSEREQTLQRRKEQLIANARTRYVQRAAARPPPQTSPPREPSPHS